MPGACREALVVGDELRGDVSAVNLHALLDHDGGLEARAGLDGQDAVRADLRREDGGRKGKVHSLCELQCGSASLLVRSQAAGVGMPAGKARETRAAAMGRSGEGRLRSEGGANCLFHRVQHTLSIAPEIRAPIISSFPAEIEATAMMSSLPRTGFASSSSLATFAESRRPQ